jgi:hypothetical protein
LIQRTRVCSAIRASGEAEEASWYRPTETDVRAQNSPVLERVKVVDDADRKWDQRDSKESEPDEPERSRRHTGALRALLMPLQGSGILTSIA